MNKKREKYRYLLNMPLSLGKQLKQLAEKQGRTIAQYILIAVKEKIAKDLGK